MVLEGLGRFSVSAIGVGCEGRAVSRDMTITRTAPAGTTPWECARPDTTVESSNDAADRRAENEILSLTKFDM
jgi:hypothetical protein